MTGKTSPIPYSGEGFKHDIFVSYSHGIPPEGGGDSSLKKWTHALIKKLKEHIGYSLHSNEPVDVWYDEKLPGNLPLTETLKKEVESSAILVIVMTRNYLDSDWCKDEREWFKNEVERRGGGVENVFVVHAMVTDADEWPDFLKDGAGKTVLGFPFCEVAKEEAARPYGWIVPEKSNTENLFVESLTNLVSAIATRMDEIRNSGPVEVPTTEPPDTGWPVLVAPGTDDVRAFSREVRKQLKQRGCLLLPREEINIEEYSPQDQKQELEIAHAFVQMLGIAASREESQSIGRVQALNELAQSESVRQFLWRQSSIPLEAIKFDPDYRQFVEGLGDLPGYTASELADDVVAYLESSEASESNDEIAYMEIPPKALDEFDRWKNDIRTDDCVILPLKPPTRGKIDEIQRERESRQLLYGQCKAVLLMYCLRDELKWLRDAIINFAKDVAIIGREERPVPVPVVIDYFGEADVLAKKSGVDVIRWEEGSDASELWEKLEGIVT